MTATQTAPELLADLAQRGFSLRTVAGKIVVTPASRLTPEDRDAIGNCRADLLAILSPGEPWNTATALRLMVDADAMVERLGVSGRHPAIADAAAMVTSAFATGDMETLQFAVGQFLTLLREVLAAREFDREKQHSA